MNIIKKILKFIGIFILISIGYIIIITGLGFIMPLIEDKIYLLIILIMIGLSTMTYIVYKEL